MTCHPLAAKKRVDEALEALRIGLTPYVLQRMQGAFGNKWRLHASRAAGAEDGDFALDAYTLLKTVLDNWREVFSAETKLRKARSYISLALDACSVLGCSGWQSPQKSVNLSVLWPDKTQIQ
jgi:hypothetical protein